LNVDKLGDLVVELHVFESLFERMEVIVERKRKHGRFGKDKDKRFVKNLVVG